MGSDNGMGPRNSMGSEDSIGFGEGMRSEDGTGYGDGMGLEDGMGYVNGMEFIDCIGSGDGNKISTIFRCPVNGGMKSTYPCFARGSWEKQRIFQNLVYHICISIEKVQPQTTSHPIVMETSNFQDQLKLQFETRKKLVNERTHNHFFCYFPIVSICF